MQDRDLPLNSDEIIVTIESDKKSLSESLEESLDPKHIQADVLSDMLMRSIIANTFGPSGVFDVID